jgi:cell division protein FtsN
MRTSRGPGGRSAFFGLAMLILGGLLFAAGVMVGRQMAVDEATKPKEPLFKIDQRDKEPKKTVDGGELVFPEVLDKKKPEPKIEPAPAPVPAPVPEAAPGGSQPSSKFEGEPNFTLQIAAYRERSQAEALVKKLSDKGYKKARIVSGEVAGKGMYYRVRLGPLPKSDAEKSRERLEREEKLKVMMLKESP